MPEARVVRIKPPEEWKKRQIETLKQVGQANYLQGIMQPKADPIAAAIEAQDRYVEQMRKEEVLARRVAGLKGVSLSDWAAYTQNIGVNRFVEGVVKREAKVDKFVKGFQPLLAEHVAKLDQMDDVTDADREQKVLANIRGLKALKGKWK